RRFLRDRSRLRRRRRRQALLVRHIRTPLLALIAVRPPPHRVWLIIDAMRRRVGVPADRFAPGVEEEVWGDAWEPQSDHRRAHPGRWGRPRLPERGDQAA